MPSKAVLNAYNGWVRSLDSDRYVMSLARMQLFDSTQIIGFEQTLHFGRLPGAMRLDACAFNIIYLIRLHTTWA